MALNPGIVEVMVYGSVPQIYIFYFTSRQQAVQLYAVNARLYRLKRFLRNDAKGQNGTLFQEF